MKIFLVGMVKNGCGQYGHRTLKLTAFEEWTDGLKWFFACWYKFTKIKSLSKICWEGMVKNWCGQSGHWTLNLTVFEKWTDGLNWFFACWYTFRKGKSWFNDICMGKVKWPWSWDPNICCVLMNLWIELIFLNVNSDVIVFG